MSERIYCKDCKWFKKNEYNEKTGYCHIVPPMWQGEGMNCKCFWAAVDLDDFCSKAEPMDENFTTGKPGDYARCGMAERREETDGCDPESPEYQYQVKIKNMEDKIEFLKDTQRVIIQSLKNDCRQFSTNGDCRMYHHGCDTNCIIMKIITKYNIP